MAPKKGKFNEYEDWLKDKKNKYYGTPSISTTTDDNEYNPLTFDWDTLASRNHQTGSIGGTSMPILGTGSTGSRITGQGRKVGPPGPISSEESEGIMDSNFLFDFLGNAAWGAAETFVVPTVVDIAQELEEPGSGIGQRLGSQPWAQESLAGKLGYLVGTGAGIMTGIGAVGKGIQLVSKGLGAGVKLATRKGLKELSEAGFQKITDSAAKNLVKESRKSIQKAQKEQMKSLKFIDKFNPFGSAKALIKGNPLANKVIANTTRDKLRNSVKSVTGASGRALDDAVESIMRVSSESLTKHMGHSLAYRLTTHTGMNANVAKFLGDAFYEANLLGIWDSVTGEIGEDVAQWYGMDETQWHFEDAYKRYLHGMRTGSLLATTRYIPGGKQVAFGKSGMIADIGTIGKLVRNRFRDVTKMSDRALKGWAHSITTSGGKFADDAFSGITGYTRTRVSKIVTSDANKSLKAADRELLESIFKTSKKDMPGLMKILLGEIRKDAAGSFTRASMGSAVMMAPAYKDAWDNGVLGTEEYPWDKVFVDHLVGMMYMKRGKNLQTYKAQPRKFGEGFFKERQIESQAEVNLRGETPVGRFYNETGMEMNGGEISKFINAMNVLGYKDKPLDLMNSMAYIDLPEAMKATYRQQIEKSTDVMSLVREIRNKFLKIEENNTRVEMDYEQNVVVNQGKAKLGTWESWTQKRITDLKDRVDKKRKEGKDVEADKAELEAMELIELNNILQEVQSLSLEGFTDKTVQHMTEVEAYDFIQSFRNLKLSNGEPLNLNNYTRLKEEFQTSKIGIATGIEEVAINHMMQSLKALGLAGDQTMVNGKIVLHESVIGALETIRKHQDPSGGMKNTPYKDPANVLLEMIAQGQGTGLIEVSSRGAVKVDPASNVIRDIKSTAEFLKLYNESTELMHELVWNPEHAKEQSWRNHIPGWEGKEGFYDPIILGQRVIWDSISDAHRYKRNEQAYYSLTNKGNDPAAKELYVFLQDKLGGQVSFRVVEQLLKNKEVRDLDLSSPKDVELATFLTQLNTALDQMNLSSSPLGNRKEIDRAGIEAIKDKVEEYLGNVFTEPTEFTAFWNYTQHKFINEITGNPNINTPQRKGIAQLLNVNSLLGVRINNKLNVRSSQALRETLLTDPNISKQERAQLEKLIYEYENKVMMPLGEAIKDNPNSINFIDTKLDLTLDSYKRSDLIQETRELISTYTALSTNELITLFTKSNKLGVSLESLNEQITKLEIELLPNAPQETKEVNQKIRDAFIELSTEAGNLTTIFQTLLSNRDYVGLQEFVNRANILDGLNKDILSTKLTDSQVILDFKKTIKDYVVDALQKRNNLLRIDDVSDINDFYERQFDNIKLNDRSNRPHSNNTSMSKQQYQTKWDLSNEFMDNMIFNPLAALNEMGISYKPGDKNYDLVQLGLTKVIDGTYTVKDYVDIVLEPIVKSKKTGIDLLIQTNKNTNQKNSPGTYEDFVIDTYHIVTGSMGTKQVPIAVYENGRLNIKHTTISNWDAGINSIARLLGLDQSIGQIMLFGSTIGLERGYTSRLTSEIRGKLEAELSSGTPVDVEYVDLLKTGDVKTIELFKDIIVGEGKNASQQFFMTRIDDKSVVLIPSIAKEKIVQTISNPNSEIRQTIKTVIKAALENANPGKRVSNVEAENATQKYLQEILPNAKFDKQSGRMDLIQIDSKQAADIVQLTRAAHTMPIDLIRVINKEVTIKDVLGTLKYIKMDNPRSGVAMNIKNLEFAREFLPRFIQPDSKMGTAYDMFVNQVFKKAKKRRDLNLFDESGKGGEFFDSKALSRKQLNEQLKINQPGLTKSEREALVDEALVIHDKQPASVVNGAKYLSLPEMVASLMSKGARKEWFIWEKNAKTDKYDIIGFNVGIKPIEMHHTVDATTGRIEVHIGKTAYVWHPKMDALMRNNVGEYVIDAIGFESTHKRHEIFDPISGKVIKPGIHLQAQNTGRFLQDASMNEIKSDGLKTSSQIYEIDRGAILLKSISGEHDATVAAGFANLLGNSSLRALNNVTRMQHTRNDMVERFQYLAGNMLSYKVISEKLLLGHKEGGDNIGKVIGVEQVLAADGVPLFEFMLPNIEKMVTSEFLGRRNLITSNLDNGSYSVMTPGSGLSLPIRTGKIQYGFGGSAISSKEWTQDLNNFMLLRKNGEGAFEVNNGEALSFVFKVTNSFLKRHNFKGDMLKAFEGSDFAISLESGGKVKILGAHYAEKWDVTNNKKLFSELEESMTNDFLKMIDKLAIDGSIKTFGDLALTLNGTRKEYVDNYRDYELNASANNKKTNNKDAMYNEFVDNKGNFNYSEIHLAKIDLRQPKPGINDWVISRVERLIDQRRGPVSEMNLMDVINPQDADFDLDKSASLYALPHRIIKDIYNVSGYQQATDAVFDTALREAGLVEGKEAYSELNAIWEGKRAPTLRQISILSTMLQYYSTKSNTGDLFTPGWVKGPEKSRFQLGPAGGYEFKDARNMKYEFSIRDGLELVNSIEYVKKLVKATVDIYKDPQNTTDINIEKLIWEHADLGFIQIKMFKGTGDKTGQNISFADLSSQGKTLFNNIKEKILQPIGKLHDLNLMTENFGDGTSRKMSAFEMVHRYDTILTDIWKAGWRWELGQDGQYKKKKTELNALTEPILHFLGMTKTGSGEVSEMPLIQTLRALKHSMNDVFGNQPPIDSGLGVVMADIVNPSAEVSIGNQRVTNSQIAIRGILSDQKSSAQISNIKFRYDKAKDIYFELVSMKKGETESAIYWKGQMEKYEALVLEFNRNINNPEVVHEQNMHRAKKKPGQMRSEFDTIHVFKVNKDQEVNVFKYKPGELVQWNAGDVVIINPKRLVAGSDKAQMIRAAMHDAFIRRDSRINTSDHLIIDNLVNQFKQALRDPNNKLIDENRPLDSHRFGLKSEGELAMLGEYLERVATINPAMAEMFQESFLHRLLTPGIQENIFSIRGFNTTTNSLSTQVNYTSNKYYESLVFKFLTRANNGQGNLIVDKTTSQNWYQGINDRFKTALIKEWDPSRVGDVFDYQKTTRGVNDFALQPERTNLPKFVLQDGLNQKAKDILHSYVMGTYFLDPIQLYRLTAGLKDVNQTLPSGAKITEIIQGYWEGVGETTYQGGNIFKPLHSYRSKIHHTVPEGTENIMDWIRKFKLNCNY
tara:strand:+ start:15592 stop:25041 length:9450 start_codon:yes stop_codon:yes gene_type:complete